jgi:lipopolysaccharide biosynthesis glycosyltransferase
MRGSGIKSCQKRSDLIKMDIVYASDERFAQILCTSLISLLESNREEDITVHILDDSITKESKNLLQAVADRYSTHLNFIPLPDLDELAGQKIDSTRWAKTTFGRLFLPIIAPNLERIIYIDCDTLVLENLSYLMQMKLPERSSCAAVVECMGDLHKANVGLRPEDPYFNAGVMLIDLNKWRKENVVKRFSQCIQRRKGCVPYVDQGVINEVLRGEIAVLPPKYNVMTVCYDFDYIEMQRYRRTKYPYERQEYTAAKKNPTIVHFTTSFLSRRPWISAKQTHPFAEKWREYKSMTPWSEASLWKDNRGMLKKGYEMLCNILPRSIAVGMSGFLHSTVKAARERDK